MVNIGIIGTGLMANIIASSCLKLGIPLHSVLSRNIESAKEFGLKFNIPLEKCFNDEGLFYSDTELKAVYIATPTTTKHYHINKAIDHHKHMLVEKPIPSIFLIEDTLSKIVKNNLVFMDASHFVHNDFMTALPKLIHDHVGKINRIDALFIWPSNDKQHIKFKPTLEPDGALGDLGWYPIRILQSLYELNESTVLSPIVFKNSIGCIVGFNAIGHTNDIIFNLSSSYSGATVRQELVISGDKGEIRVDDFVMPYCGSFVYGKTSDSLEVTISSGYQPLIDKTVKHITFTDCQHHKMLKNFVSYIANNSKERRLDSQYQMQETISMIESIKKKSTVIHV